MNAAATPRRQSKAEAAISDEMMAFQHAFVGRGPDRIRTRMVEDLVIVRSFGVFTSAEKQLATSYEGRGLIKAMRQLVLEAGLPILENIVKKHTGPRSSRSTRISPPRVGSGWTSS